MSFYLLVLCGFAGGVLGGMGMGGGTAPIPLLTIFLGLPQTVAQGINLISFLPMSLLALSVHFKNGLLKGGGLKWIIPSAMIFAGGGALLAVVLPAVILRKAFAVFLIILSFFEFSAAWKMNPSEKKFQKYQK